MVKSISERISCEIWYLKAIAIFTIFFAHMPIDAANPYIDVLKPSFDIIGMIGVPLFLFLSGYLYKEGKLFKRTVGLAVPLLIWGSFTFFVHLLPLHFKCSFIDYVYWMIGSNSYLYFVPVLLCIIALYKVANISVLWLLTGIISIGLSESHVIHYTSNFTPYLNPFNFIFFFSGGGNSSQVGLVGLVAKKIYCFDVFNADSFTIICL